MEADLQDLAFRTGATLEAGEVPTGLMKDVIRSLEKQVHALDRVIQDLLLENRLPPDVAPKKDSQRLDRR